MKNNYQFSTINSQLNVPELRFPEFVGEWVEKKLGDCTTKIGSGKTPRGGDKVYLKKGIPFIRSQNVINEVLVLDETHISEEMHFEMKSSKVIANDILLNITGGSIGRSCVVPDNFNEGNVNQHVSIIRLQQDDSKFLQSILSSWRGQKLVYQGMTGSGREGLNFESIKGFKIKFPSPPEQTRIATFLTAVDKRINLLQKKKAELEQYKKGVMQKLFSVAETHGRASQQSETIGRTPQQSETIGRASQQSETIGRASQQSETIGRTPQQSETIGRASQQTETIRFKDENGNDFPDWEEKKLGEVGTFLTSSVDKLSKKNENKVFLVNYMNVYRHEDIKNSTRDKLQIVTAKENQIKSSDLKKGDILFTPSSETPTDIGHSVVIFEDLKNTLFSYHLMRFRPNIELNILYSHYFCNIPSVLKQLSRFATGSTRFTISVGNFSKVKVHLPTIPEQQKIANFLSSIDKSIEKLGNQIDDSIVFKQGLLQKMFV